MSVDLLDPSGIPVRVVAGTHTAARAARAAAAVLNFGHDLLRTNATQRPPREPARIQRLGHVVLQSTRYFEALNWYLDTLGMIVSDFLYFPGQRDRGPTMASSAATAATPRPTTTPWPWRSGPRNRYVHSAYQVSDLDAMAAGGEYLSERGYQRSWGIGRHIQGSQIFDYWRDPDGFLVEHFADGDMFDSTPGTRLGAVHRHRAGPVGPPVTQGLPRHRPGAASRSRHCARCTARCATTTTNSPSPACAAS